MIVTEREGDIFSTLTTNEFRAYAHGVNCQGVMGAGVAKGFKAQWPDMYERYANVCAKKELRPGQCLPFFDDLHNMWVFNLATQDRPGPDASLFWVEWSAGAMVRQMKAVGLSRVATVRIGCGIGGLQWDEVKPVLESVGPDSIECVVFRPEGT